MRVILNLLVPFFLSFTCVVQADYLYAVSWYSADCDDNEAESSLDAIGKEFDTLLGGKTWKHLIKKNNGADRELQAETQGLRGLCNYRCATACANYPTCFEMYNCDECGYRRELIGTDRFLTAGALQEALIIACKAALDNEGNSPGQGTYSDNCKAAMIDATCEVVITE
jgi:hypothetical protein